MKFKILSFFIILFLLLCFSFSINAADTTEYDTVINKMNQAYANIQTYSAYFIKRELIKDVGMVTEHIDLVFKKPFNVRLNYREGPKKNLTVVYQEGKNDNMLRVKKSGIIMRFFTFSLDPKGKMAMENNHHDITKIGLGSLIDIITDNFKRAQRYNEIRIINHGYNNFKNTPAYHYEAILPRDKDKGYYCHRIILYIDKNTYLPVKIQIIDWDNNLYEDYTYLDIKINIELDDEIFNL
jgi:outer membrane lipoprotein-sorting protein